MFAQTPVANAPVQSRTNNTFATTFTGPVYQDRRAQDAARNQSMAQAAYAGEERQYRSQQGKGVAAGSKMASYRAGMQATAEAGKAYAQAQQDMFNRMSGKASADLQFQERLAGEQGWVRDLLLDQKDIQQRERLASYKRFADINLADYERKIKEAIAAEARKTEILGGLL